MSKNVYIGVGGVARKVKNIYIGVGGVARKVKKGYIGVGGVARLFYSSSGYQSTITNAYTRGSWGRPIAMSIGNYAIFGGGISGTSANTDVYDTSLTHSIKTFIFLNGNTAGASIGDGTKYCCYIEGNYGYRHYTISRSLTQIDLFSKITPSQEANGMKACSFKNYIVFIGGSGGGSDELNCGPTYAINDNLTWTSLRQLGPTLNFGVASNDTYLLAGGGTYENMTSSLGRHSITYNNLRSLNTSLTVSDVETMHLGGLCASSAVRLNNKILFLDGSVYSFNSSLTKITAGELTGSNGNGRPLSTGVVFNNKSGFTSGYDDVTVNGYGYMTSLVSGNYSNAIDLFDDSLTKTNDVTLSVGRYNSCSTSVGDYVLIGYGSTSDSSTSNIIDVYTKQM